MIVKDNAKEHALPTPGMHNGVCVDVYDAGVVETQWGPKEKIMLVWEIDEDHPDFDGPFRVNRKYTQSLNEKASLCQDLESWRGRQFTPEEKAGFETETLIGVSCQFNIVHNTDAQGRTWANVKAVLPLGKGQEPFAPSGYYVRVKDRKDEDEAAQEQNGKAPEAVEQQAFIADDDLPF